jgi:hypothetical protein
VTRPSAFHTPATTKPDIIADTGTSLDARTRAVARAVAVVTLLVGCAAAWHYSGAGLTLSHYDAKAHLVVARRVLDSLTPGWKQVGGVWLPLPHLLNLVPVQIDAFYRTGFSGVLISILSFGLAAWSCSRIVLRLTGSALGAVAAGAVLLSSADMLYLQATPMTEALLLGLTTLAVLLVVEWVEDPVPRRLHAAGAAIGAACLTRYEAWPVTGALLALAWLALSMRGMAPRQAVGRVMRLALYPILAALGFLVQSRLSTGAWFVTGGFFVADNPDLARPFKAIGSVWWGTHVLNGYGVLLFAVAAALVLTVAALSSRRRSSALIVLALAATAALPWYAFFQGHPFRIRYMVPLLAALAAWSGTGIGMLPRRMKWAAALALAVILAWQARPLNPRAPMVLEAQLDRANGLERRDRVTSYLSRHRQGEKVLVSFGSLSHYVHELSAAGFRIRDFIHEGNDVIWNAALEHPYAHAGWILVEERAEGGDVLFARAAEDPERFLEHFERVAEGGGVALYRRTFKP